MEEENFLRKVTVVSSHPHSGVYVQYDSDVKVNVQDALEKCKFFPYDIPLNLCIFFINLYTYKYLIYALNTCTMFELVIFIQLCKI